MRRSNILLAVGVMAAGLVLMLSVSRVLYQPDSRSGGQSRLKSLRKTDGDGNLWLLDVAGGPRLASADPNGPKAGPPIVVKTDVQRGAGQVLIGLVLEGQAGERYRPPRRNGMTVPAPKLQIVDETGKAVADGKFQYG